MLCQEDLPGVFLGPLGAWVSYHKSWTILYQTRSLSPLWVNTSKSSSELQGRTIPSPEHTQGRTRSFPGAAPTVNGRQVGLGHRILLKGEGTKLLSRVSMLPRLYVEVRRGVAKKPIFITAMLFTVFYNYSLMNLPSHYIKSFLDTGFIFYLSLWSKCLA